MPSNDNDSDVMERTNGGRKRSTSGPSGGRPTVMQLLWADLRKRSIPSEPSEEELAYIEMEEANRRQNEEVLAKAHHYDPVMLDKMIRRYGA